MHTVKDWAAWVFYLYEEDSRAGGEAEEDADEEDACSHGSTLAAFRAGAAARGLGRGRRESMLSLATVATTFRSFIPGWGHMTQALTDYVRCRQGPEESDKVNRARGLYNADAMAKRRRQQELYTKILTFDPNSQAEFFTTTRLIVNVYPHLKRRSPLPHFDSSIPKWKVAAQEALDHESLENWVKIEYLHRWPDGMERFCIGGSLEDIIPDYDEDRSGSSLKTVEDFFNSLLYIVRNLQSVIYCNGYDIIQPPTAAQRIECVRFQLNPFRIVLRVAESEELEIGRLPDRIALTATANDQTKKEFQILCADADYPPSAIKIDVPDDGTGTVIIDFPAFVKGSEVWFSELYD